MRVKSGYLGVLTDRLRRRGFRWGASKLFKYLALRGSLAVNRAWFGPFVAELSLTYRCPCSCVMCGLPKRHQAGREALSLSGFVDLVDCLAAMGTEVISLGGGEPLLFDGLVDLVAAVSRHDLACKLNTTGSPLTADQAESLVKAGLSAVAVSLDGATPGSHDALRGRSGAFQQAHRAVEFFDRARATAGRSLRISATCVLSGRNQEEAGPICRALQSWPVDHIGFMPVQRSAGGEHWPARPDRLAPILETLARKPKVDLTSAYRARISRPGSRKRCGAGLLTCVVDCYGDVYPCEAWYAEGKPVGNIRTTGFPEVWHGSRYREVRGRLRFCSRCSWDCQEEINSLFGL